jgi:RecA-family ATPase
MEAIRAQADKCRADVVLIDSVYLMLNGDESDPLAVAELLKELVKLCDTRAVAFTHHYAKGSASAQAQKSAIDRASGSSWWSRFADVLIPLTPPVQEPGDTRKTLIVEPSIRHHPQMDPISIEWTEGPRFRMLSAEQTETLQQARPIRESQSDLRQAKNAKDREVQVLAEVQELSEGEGSVSLSKLRTKCKSIATGGTFTRILERLVGQKQILHFQDKKGGHRIRLAQEVVQLRFEEDPPPGGLVDVELEDEEIPEQTLEEALRDG